MNIRILAASTLAFAILVPAANAAPVKQAHPAVASNKKSDNCAADSVNLVSTKCKISGASFNFQKEPAVVEASSSDMDRGTGGSGSPAWVPKAHKMLVIMKANPSLSFGDVGITVRD
jgi:hypothetical protein